ncbi:unnamed protein product [Ilex paraguariensis]|uniref:Uncharacterized protein n=1 Tax=Ilex paraguariensis TaxID=185542 RepID=A0ABC8TPC2_9AQUA
MLPPVSENRNADNAELRLKVCVLLHQPLEAVAIGLTGFGNNETLALPQVKDLQNNNQVKHRR